MTTPTHYRFEFDPDGTVVFAQRIAPDNLGPDEHRLYAPQVYPGTRGAIVPMESHILRAEITARLLVEENGGFGA